MKKLPERYQCETCGMIFPSKEMALECEDRGPETYPAGMIFGNPAKGEFYENITLCIAWIEMHHHSNDSPCWVCRDNGHGDELAGGGNSLELGLDDIPDPQTSYIQADGGLAERESPRYSPYRLEWKAARGPGCKGRPAKENREGDGRVLGRHAVTIEVACPQCGHEQDEDEDNDVILCDECGHQYFVEESPC